MAPPLVVVWRVTEACDLACPFCAYSRDLRRSRRQATLAEALAFGAALRDFAAHTGRPVHLSWLGGEPLLWPPLAEASRTMAAWGLSLGLTTNGTRLADAAIRQLLTAHFALLTISVDAIGAEHDALRGQAGLARDLAQAVRTLASAPRGQRPTLRANIVLLRSTLSRFEALCAELAGWGVEEVTFNLLGGVDRPGPFIDRERPLPEQVTDLAAALPEIRRRLAPLVIHGSGAYLARLREQAEGAARPVADCGPGGHFLFVDEHGRAAPCSFTLAEYGVPVSTLTTAAAIAALPAHWATARRRERALPCYDCRSTQVFGKYADEHPTLHPEVRLHPTSASGL